MTLGENLPKEAALLLKGFACVLDGKNATYLSGPITTGIRMVELLASIEALGPLMDSKELAAKRVQVIHLNELDIEKRARALRERSVLVIEPASLQMPEWTQKDYYDFWFLVLDQFVSRMVMLDGWEYSVGCVNEFLHATRSKLPVESAAGIPIGRKDGFALISAASRAIEARDSSNVELAALASRLVEFGKGNNV